MAVCRSLDVQVCKGQSDLEALGHAQVPLLLQVVGVRLGVLGRLDLSIHLGLGLQQRPAHAHHHMHKAGEISKQREFDLFISWLCAEPLVQSWCKQIMEKMVRLLPSCKTFKHF